jgi:hypothetical protein
MSNKNKEKLLMEVLMELSSEQIKKLRQVVDYKDIFERATPIETVFHEISESLDIC